MYTEEDHRQAEALLKKRMWIATLPAALIAVVGIVLFVIGRMQRSDSMWIATAVLTILAGVYFLFLYGVYARPVRLYRKHVEYMLGGRMRETCGVFKSFAEETSDREGLECHALFINVGDKDDPEDDRLLYYDAQKPRPEIPLGTRVKVLSNDKMIASFQRV